jgi:preprotein translocase subunit SecD
MAQALVSVKLGPSAKKVLETRPDTEKPPFTQAIIGDPPRPVQTAIRFECRLAEAHEAAGLRKARVAGSEQRVYLHQDIIISNGHISRTRIVQGNGPSLFNVAVEFGRAGAEKMRQATARHPGGLLAILVNGSVLAAPTLTESISTSVVISGNYSRAEAERLANGLAIR